MYKNSKFKKGFSLIEVSVILIIISLLITLSLKGRTLISEATTKKEINKIIKFEEAVKTYVGQGYDRKDREPFMQKRFIELELLSEEDFRTAYYTEEYKYYIYNCSINKNILEPSETKSSFCASVFAKYGDSFTPAEIHPRFTCSFEIATDDERLLSGNARYARGKMGAFYPEAPAGYFQNCFNAEQIDPEASYGYILMY